MAKTTATPPSTESTSVTITQQSLNLIRQMLSAVGWAKSVTQIYLGGKLLEDTLPSPDATDWVKSDAEQRAMTKAQRTAYAKQDQEWAHKEIHLILSPKEVETIKTALEFVAGTGSLAPNRYVSEIIKVLGIKVE